MCNHCAITIVHRRAPQSSDRICIDKIIFSPQKTAFSVSIEPAVLDQSIVIEPERIQSASVVDGKLLR